MHTAFFGGKRGNLFASIFSSGGDRSCQMPSSVQTPSNEMDRKSLLLIKPGSMGDVIHALPVASAIRRSRPDVELTWVLDPRWAPLLEGNPAVNRVHLFPRQEFRGLSGWYRAVGWYFSLGGLKPDLVLDLQGLLRSALISKFCRGKEVVGLDDAREGARFFYKKCVRTTSGEHSVRRYLRCLPLLGIPEPETCEFFLPSGRSPSLPADYIVLHPFARGAGKSMEPGTIREFVKEYLVRSKKRIVIVGMGEAPDSLPAQVINLVGKTSLAELIGVLRGARFVVSVDSGPMHLAAAVGAPLLGIHTWSDPRLVGPFRENAWIWQGGEICRQDFNRTPLVEKNLTLEFTAEIARFVAGQTG